MPPTSPRAASSASTPVCAVTGYGVIMQAQHKLRYVTSGCIRARRAQLPARLKIILQRSARSHCIDSSPTEVAVEIVFVNVNPQSTLLLGQARGAAISAAVLADLPVAEYTALQVKQAVVGTRQRRQGTGAGNGPPAAATCPWHPPRMPPTRSPARSATRMAARVSAGCAGAVIGFATAASCERRTAGIAMIGRISGTLLEKNPPQVLRRRPRRRLRDRRADEHVLQPARPGREGDAVHAPGRA